MTAAPPQKPKSTEATLGDTFEIHRQMVIALFIATVIVVAILSLGLILAAYDVLPQFTILMVVAAAGALGGFVSALRRLYAFQRFFPSDFFNNRKGVNFYLVIYSLIPPLVGCIAAATLYVIFASGILQGVVFPKFFLSERDPKITDFQNFLQHWHPEKPEDYAKAIVWSFLAGFSERFVPNLLDRLASAHQDDLDQTGKNAAGK